MPGRASALDRILEVLDQLQAAGRPMTGYDIAKTTGAPLSTVYALIERMVVQGLLSRRTDGTVWIGARIYGYGLLYEGSLEFLDVARDEMHMLSREVQETIQICGRDEGMMVVLQMAEGPGHFRVTSRIGSRLPINWTASGRILLGHLPLETRVALFGKWGRPSPTGLAPTDARELARMSGEALAMRLSVQIGESESFVACLAAPVINLEGECVITISIVLPVAKAVERRQFYVDAAQAAAARIEKRLGWALRPTEHAIGRDRA